MVELALDLEAQVLQLCIDVAMAFTVCAIDRRRNQYVSCFPTPNGFESKMASDVKGQPCTANKHSQKSFFDLLRLTWQLKSGTL